MQRDQNAIKGATSLIQQKNKKYIRSSPDKPDQHRSPFHRTYDKFQNIHPALHYVPIPLPIAWSTLQFFVRLLNDQLVVVLCYMAVMVWLADLSLKIRHTK